MKKLTLVMLLLAGFGAVHADELSDAQKLWENKDFYKSFQIFNKLAEAGNVNAQLQLGEMYGFGEGTAEDTEKAAYWLKQAAAKGHPEAAASLALVQERKAHHVDIAYYTTSFDGGSAAYSRYGCERPQIPAKSTSNEDIRKVNAKINTWTECYGRFIVNLRSVAPADKTIKPEILKLMNNEEFNRSAALINKVYGNILAEAAAIEQNISNESSAWKKSTELYAAEYDKKLVQDKITSDNEIRVLETTRRNMEHSMFTTSYKK
ncbi:tetratricopeptide repeat protein [Janthinobacterium lividum]